MDPAAGGSPDTDGFFRLARPVPIETKVLLARMTTVLFAVAGSGGLLLVAFTQRFVHPGGLAFAAAASLATAAAMFLLSTREKYLERWFAPAVYVTIALATTLVAVAQYSAGPAYVVALIVYVEVPIFSFYLLRPSVAFGTVGLIGLQFAAVVLLQDGYAAPFGQWAYLVGSLVAIGMIFGGLLRRGVDESMRLERLKRFLAPQIADAVLSSGSSALLAPHRRQIAVVFCDLRGFTSFAAGAEPEDVVDVLNEYYQRVGTVLRSAEATIGTFAGDGIMAYFNDPVPCDDPAWTAVRVSLDVRGPMEELVARWSSRGFDLGYGIGVAYGYATLGAIGFESRHDYTALGSVVNLAARLSDKAGFGEILIDQRAYNAVDERCVAVERSVEIKGFPGTMTAYALTEERVRRISADR